jgi:hypothetical protein
MAWWKLVATKWGKWCRLGWPERWLLAQAVLLLPLTRLGLRALGWRRWCAVLGRLGPRLQGRADTPLASKEQQARATARMVQAAARHGLCGASCLPQSLVLWWLLRRQGIPGELRIGVRRHEGRLQGHAWVEHAGRSLEEHEDNRYRFARFDRAVLASDKHERERQAGAGTTGSRPAQLTA